MVVLVIATPPLICVPKENRIIVCGALGGDDEVVREDAVNHNERIGSVLFSGITND
jgi:hypothetical protein